MQINQASQASVDGKRDMTVTWECIVEGFELAGFLPSVVAGRPAAQWPWHNLKPSSLEELSGVKLYKIHRNPWYEGACCS